MSFYGARPGLQANKAIIRVEDKPNAAFQGMFASKRFGMKKPAIAGPKAKAAITATISTSATAGTDAALEILKKSLATESQKKADNT